MDGKNPVDVLSLNSGRLQKPQTSQLGRDVNESSYIPMKERVERSPARLQVGPSFLHCLTGVLKSMVHTDTQYRQLMFCFFSL